MLLALRGGSDLAISATFEADLFDGFVIGPNRLRKKARFREIWPKGHQQGLKPIDSFGFIGRTEVVPCYKAPEMELFRSQ